MANDDIWILGINMTKFGKHKDKDVLDLASEAALAALADGGVTMKDMGVIAAGNLMGGGGVAQQLQKQIGQTGIPAYNVSNACATGATALRVAYLTLKAGEADMGLAVGVEKLAGAGLLAGGSRADDGDSWQRSGRFGAVAPVDGRIGTETMPGVFAPLDASVTRAASCNHDRLAIILSRRLNLRSLSAADHVASLLCISLIIKGLHLSTGS